MEEPLLLDETQIDQLDTLSMIDHISTLPEQIIQAWKDSASLTVPTLTNISNIVILGMGGSAIGGSLLSSLLSTECPVPIFSNRDYDIPSFVNENSLVIASSYSGNTEETLTALSLAHKQNAQIVTISTGGQLIKDTKSYGGTSWIFNHQSQPRAALGYSLILPLILLNRLGLIRDFTNDIKETHQILLHQNKIFGKSSPLSNNPAKRLAGQMLERIVVIFTAEPLSPVARRWRGQIAENSKAWAQYEDIPEMNHNSVVGLNKPDAFIDNTFILFLDSPQLHPRNQYRMQLTRELVLGSGYNCDTIMSNGESRLAQMLSLVHYGDYVSLYLAIAYGEDPSPVENIAWLKSKLSESDSDNK